MKRLTALLCALFFTFCFLGGCTVSAETPPPAPTETAQQVPAAVESVPVENTQAAEPPTVQTDVPASLTPRMLARKNALLNPYVANSEANIHNDCYNSDVTDAVLSLGIFPEVNAALEKENPNAAPAIFFDALKHAVSPMIGGIAIRDMDGENTRTLGCYIPAKHDGGNYAIQVSYSYVDAENHLVCPTSNNHLVIFKTMDADGNILPVFEKLMDIDVMALAEKALGKVCTQNILSVVPDYAGNLWFATGGFRIYPERKQLGLIGYIAKDIIDASIAGKKPDAANGVFFYEPEPGEAAENGIASSADGAVILTNLACYLFRANNGVEVVWRAPYESVGAKGDEKGGGLAWGGGSSPTLSNNLVCFTDNLDPVNLIALDMKTGERVAEMPILDDLPEGTPVSVENSIILYDDGAGTASAIVCNWYGASNPGLADPDSDSSVQTYENIYNSSWIENGNIAIMPGMERADIVKTKDGYEMKSVWCRNDLRDTSMFKLSTATGYLYGYVQDMNTGMWQYIVLDFATGETVLTVDVSSNAGYNNMAIGMFADRTDNALYCPTGYRELLRLQDRFAYLPELPYRKIDLDLTSRQSLSAEEFTNGGGVGMPATFLHTVTVENVHPKTTVALRVNGLTGDLCAYTLYAYNTAGKLSAVPNALWSIKGRGGETKASDIVEIWFVCEDGGAFDLSTAEKTVTVSALLAHA